ncbi:methyltransferase domain-containing protein [Sulfurospirillum arcachonense]|uniref:methyltransferase domain-containing protein n=1 Tax=Sulfurospirillum arcachonense TaxID=57666 RepID=UPI00046A2D33|nr:methyltransferase domain-containing protein [Sulfurospirillum arcachonense]
MKHIREFSKQSHSYDANTIVQKKVAKYLLSKIKSKPKKILDLGCGTGDINKKITWQYENFIGIDCAKGMCEKHPVSSNILVLNENFESESFQKKIQKFAPFDIVISSSALQWSDDIEELIKFTASLSKNIAFSIFTCNTFKDIYNVSGLKTFLPDAKELVTIIKKYFDINYEIKTYKVVFDDNMSIFRYIKKSGVSGGKKKLTVTQTKNLIRNYPHDYLEFEVLYVVSPSV